MEFVVNLKVLGQVKSSPSFFSLDEARLVLIPYKSTLPNVLHDVEGYL